MSIKENSKQILLIGGKHVCYISVFSLKYWI